MRITEKKTITEEVEETTDILCNMCGESCKKGINDHIEYEGLLEASFCGGFFSKIGDGLEFVFSICEKCLVKLFDNFKLPPQISGGVLQQDSDFYTWSNGCVITKDDIEDMKRAHESCDEIYGHPFKEDVECITTSRKVVFEPGGTVIEEDLDIHFEEKGDDIPFSD